MYILVVEDEAPKREHLQAFVEDEMPKAECDSARSVRSAVASIRRRTPDLILLDMSLPTFDVTASESGGRPQGFGGREVLRYMDRFGICAKTIIVTAYEAFFSEDRRELALTDLADALAAEHPSNYAGLVYYNSVFGEWRDRLRRLIKDGDLDAPSRS